VRDVGINRAVQTTQGCREEGRAARTDEEVTASVTGASDWGGECLYLPQIQCVCGQCVCIQWQTSSQTSW